jgi:hypothetical protein
MGTNEDEELSPYRPNLLHDFITNTSVSWSNRLASFFYSYVYWLIIGYLYIVATYRQSLFYLLILLICFYLLWHGQSFLQRPFPKQKSFWRLLILSFFSLFLAHLFMQPLSCILVHYTSIQHRCILINLFNIPCSIKLFRQAYAKDCPENSFWTQVRGIIVDRFLLERKIFILGKHHEKQHWRVYCEESFHNNSIATIYTRRAFYCQSEYNRLIFDAIGFLLVLLFIRLLNSYSFFYVSLELQVQAELSQMGASLLSQLNWLKLVEYRKRTANELESIKARVTQIRQRRVS